MQFLKRNKYILLICLLGFTLRLLYYTALTNYVSGVYFNTFFRDMSDFHDWLTAIRNLLENNTYSTDLNSEYGYFSRMPGYPLFILPFYYLFGYDYFMPIISYTQIVLDSISIFLIYKITRKVFPNSNYPYIAPLLFAVSPMNVFWAPALLSETLSVFLLMVAFYIYTCTNYKYKYLYIGLITGFNILVRPQLAVFALVFGIYYVLRFFSKPVERKQIFYSMLFFSTGILLTYGLWPLRNYVNYNKVVLTHDIRGIKTWSPEVFAYMEYTFSVQTAWNPQFEQILHNAPYEVDPKNAYVVPGDSADLALAIHLAKNCGSGFSIWPLYWKEKVEPNPCDDRIVKLFNKLHDHQLTHNKFHYWVVLPLEVMKKCLFKTGIHDHSTSFFHRVSSLGFAYRSLILLLGIAGAILCMRKKFFTPVSIIFLFFISWLLLLSFGPTGFMRNVEFRYLIQTDSLLLIPASCMIGMMLDFIRKKNHTKSSSTY